MEEEDERRAEGLSITADPRFERGVALFNDGEYLEASDLFEELFFEAVNHEPDFIRIFLQFSVGIYHSQLSQRRPAVERIDEGLSLVAANRDDLGIDLRSLADGMRAGANQIRENAKPAWPKITMRRVAPAP